MSAQGTHGAQPRQVRVHGESQGFVQEVSVGRHQLTADEPVELGGSDLGPNPYDLLLAALGACTSMTISMYARRKQWSLAAVTVTLRHARIYAADCAECEQKQGMVDRIEREIELRGELSAEQRARLLEIAGKCPVHKTLTSDILVQTRLAEPSP